MTADLEPLADHEIGAIQATVSEITERAIEADVDPADLATTIGAAERASGPEVVGVPVPVAIRLVAELLRLRAAVGSLQLKEVE